MLLGAFLMSGCCVALPKLVTKSVPYAAPAAAHAIEESSAEWHDAKRNRDVPVRLYVPADVKSPMPVVIFSHGIGEDRDSYAYLGRALARNGFIAVHITHAGTDKAVLKTGYLNLYRATKKKENWVARPLDVSFVLDRLSSDPRADLARVAATGHSAGSFTAFAIAGMRASGGETLRDPRVKVAVAMSMPRLDGVVEPGGYDSVAIPLLNVTGTCDSSLIYRTLPRHRRIPFEQSHAANQYLLTFEGVNHNTFSNAEDRHHELIAAVTVQFLRAWLLNDAAARRWFDEQGRAKVNGTELTIERK